MSQPDRAAALIEPSGQPLRRAVKDDRCPQCTATRDRRVLSGGFGEPHDVCGACGYDFQERTL